MTRPPAKPKRWPRDRREYDIRLGAARQAVGGAHQCRLVGLLDREDVDEPAAEDDDDAVADALHLFELRGVEQHGLAVAGELAQQLVDFLLGADIDAARGVEAQDGAGIGPRSAGDGHLLLVAADRRCTSPCARVSICSPLDGAEHRGALLAHGNRPPSCGARH